MQEVLAANQCKYAAQVRLMEIIAAFARCMAPLDLGLLEQGAQACLDNMQEYGEHLQDLLQNLAFHPRYFWPSVHSFHATPSPWLLHYCPLASPLAALSQFLLICCVSMLTDLRGAVEGPMLCMALTLCLMQTPHQGLRPVD